MLKLNTAFVDTRLVTRAVMIALMVTAATPALAAGNGDWIKPFTDLFDNVNTGLIKVVISVLGFGTLAWGLYTAGSGKFDMLRLAAIVIGGGVGIYGSGAMELLFGGS